MSTVVWLFGRGASIECGLTWCESEYARGLEREERTRLIETELQCEMLKPHINTAIYRNLIQNLNNQTPVGSQHLFITTNWDYLLQKEIDAHIKQIRPGHKPSWLLNSRVYHINGSVEPVDKANRTPMYFETDLYDARRQSQEMNKALGYLIWEKCIVVIGMSLKCPMDNALICYLGQHQDNLPVGEATWNVVNPDTSDLEETCMLLRRALPRASINRFVNTFSKWLEMDKAEQCYA